MTKAFISLIVAAAVLWTFNALAQTAEPQPKIVVDAPLPEPLSRGVALIRYRTENLQILPVFGPQALGLSPRIGHLQWRLMAHRGYGLTPAAGPSLSLV
jgi:hypothetical protein